MLGIAGARRLTDFDVLRSTGPTMRELDIESCPQLDALEALSTLRDLRYLGISQCGSIRSLEPIVSLSRLETLYAWGTTRIEDNDLSPLLQLPALKEIRMRSRRGYQPSLADVKGRLGAE